MSDRNLQLGIFSIIFSVSGMIFYSLEDILELGLFYGYNTAVFILIIITSAGGLIVAASIKYADSILKGFATSLSVIVSSLCSWYFFQEIDPDQHFMLGASLVVSASALYGSNCDFSTTAHDENNKS